MLRTHSAHDVSLSTVNKLTSRYGSNALFFALGYLYIPVPVQRLCPPYCMWMPDPALQCTGLLRSQLCSPFYTWLDHAFHLFQWFLFYSLFFQQEWGECFQRFIQFILNCFLAQKRFLNTFEYIWRNHPKYLELSGWFYLC